ncbi:glycosyltransferase family 4 protein [Sphingomonas sp. URHD0057]|uniref:glycosyltransferase family 4 protein n=1 Tax=Sphingomonas sp. URHD0057 TaxID=1380389 RepID=UPI0006847ED2|nr:glycosyltransferase family 4 protein [Sphingomonas sp. URHD0057]
MPSNRAKRLLFVHDHRFLVDDAGSVFTSGSLPAHVWTRYLETFECIEVLARDGGAPPAGQQPALASRAGVTFNLVRNLGSHLEQLIRPKALKLRIRAAVEGCSAALIRLPSELGFLAAAECERAGKPYAIEVVGCAWDGMRNHGSLAGRLYAPFFYWRTRNAVQRAPLALYVTSRWLQQRYPTRGQAYAASDVEIAPMTAAREAARRKRLERIAKGERPILGTVASLRIRSKGVQTALAALSELRRGGLDLRYRLLGTGDPVQWKRLAADLGIADLVSFDGVRSAGDGVRKWLDQIDVHLQPSFQEGLPRATIEAMSRGLACIGSTAGGIPELLPADRLHAPGDSSALARQIRALANDPSALALASAHDLRASRSFDPRELAGIRSEFLGRLAGMVRASGAHP